MAKKIHSNLGKLNTSTMQSFTNDKMMLKLTKTLFIKTDEELINKFKIISFDFYKEKNKISLHSYRHYLVVVLLNLEKHFKAVYGKIEEPDEEYVNFYKKKGRKALNRGEDVVISGINFLVSQKYSWLYFTLMHTYYINEKSSSPSYSISQFFEYIVSYIETNSIELEDVYF